MANEITLDFNFDNPSNYIYDTSKIDVSGGQAKLKLIDSPNQNFELLFDNDTGFVYDPTKSEFVGSKVQQKDQRPTNSIIAAKYTNSLNANWGADGVATTAVLNGVPTLSGGKLVCTGSQGVYYEDVQIGALSGDLALKFKFTPNYSTGPASNVNLVTITQATGLVDSIIIFNSPAGNNIRITANGLSANSFGVWEPTAGQEYVFELFCISNVITLYIDGVQLGLGKTLTPSQGTTSNRLWIGACTNIYNNSQGSFDDVILYSLATQDENYTIPENIYLESAVTTPELEYTGTGTLISFDSFITIENNSPRYTIQIGQSGDYLYWDGSNWGVSDGTYNQATNTTVFNNNIGTLNVNGQIYGQFKIHFPDGNNQSAVDNLLASLTAQIYPTDNPTIEPVGLLGIEELIDFQEDVTKLGLDDIRYTLKKGNNFYWYNGVDWAVSNETYTETNTATEILNNILTFTNDYVTFKWFAFIHSDDGSSTPAIKTLTIIFDFVGVGEDKNLCNVWGYNYTPECLPDVRPFTVRLSNDASKYLNLNIIRNPDITVTPRANGYWEVELLETENMPISVYYNFIFGNITYRKDIPNETTKNFWDLADA